MKWRNSKERELLSVGGSREQTLPSKDNQNPDLSDPHDPGLRDADIGDTQGRTQSRSKSDLFVIFDKAWYI